MSDNLTSLATTNHDHKVIDSDLIFKVDSFNREITAENPQKELLIQGDHRCERFSFEIPRYIEGHDMYLCNSTQVYFLNVEDKKRDNKHITGVYTFDDLHIDTENPDKLIASWLISGNATKFAGILQFMLVFSCIDGTRVDYKWCTKIFEGIKVIESLDADLSFESDYSDVIEQWKATLKIELTDHIDESVKDSIEAVETRINNNLNAAVEEHVADTDKTLEAFNDILEKEITTMDSEIDVLKARMDTFTSLPEGATAGDAELADIRMGADGVVYGSAGSAVREPIGNIRKIVGYQSIATVGETPATNVVLNPPIPKGVKIIKIIGVDFVNAREDASTVDKQVLRAGDTTDRLVQYINVSTSNVVKGDVITIITESTFTNLENTIENSLRVKDINNADLVLQGYITNDGSFAPHDSWTTWCFFKNSLFKNIKVHLTSNNILINAISFFNSNSVGAASFVEGVPFIADLHATDGSLITNYESKIIDDYELIAVSSRTNGDEIIDIFADSTALQTIVDQYEQCENYDSVGRAEFKLEDIECGSDMTWVNNRLVVFDAQAGYDQIYNNEPESTIRIYEFGDNISDGYINMYTLKHKFGHCNTVDYNPYNDCLILGNGSGSYALLGEIIIIPNFASLVNVTESSDDVLTLEDVNALIIDCSTYNLGAKFNLIWGDENDGRHNIAYLITAKQDGNILDKFGGDIGTIRKLVLLKYEDVGEYGVIADNEFTTFNGTFNIVETYAQKTNGYENCIQGACYYKGEIYACVGHDGMWYWRMRLDNGRIFRKNYKQISYYNNIGEVSPRTSSGICVKDGFMYMGQVGIHAFRL